MTGAVRPETPTLNNMAARFQARAEGAIAQVLKHNPQSLQELQKAIYAGGIIVGKDDGTWAVRTRVEQIFYDILGALLGRDYTKKADLDLATYFESYLKSFEVKSSKFKYGIGQDARNEEQIEKTKEAIIRRLRMHENAEQRTIVVKQKSKDGKTALKTLEQLIDERTVLRSKQKLHFSKDKVLETSEYNKIEEELFELDMLIREGRQHAFAALGIHRIERQMVAALYRGKNQKKIYCKKNQTNAAKSCSEHNRRWLTKDLLRWKEQLLDRTDKEGKPLPPTPNVQRELTHRDKEKIVQTCHFPKFVKLLKEDPELREEYYKFVFRNTADGGKDAADIAIELPVHQQKLMKCVLDKREGRLHDLFKIQEEPFHQEGEHRTGLRKFVAIKIEGDECDMYDVKRKVTFDRGTAYQVVRTVGEVFASFSNKNREMGEYETIQSKGITRLHGVVNADFGQPREQLTVAQRIARFFAPVPRSLPPAINLHQKDWMRQLKPMETLTHAEVVARYGVEPLHALLAVRATRAQPPQEQSLVRIDESHSFLELVVPVGNGKFDVFPYGKYAFPWPHGVLDTLFYIFNTQRGIIRMDENSFYNHRHHAAYALQADANEVALFWEKLRRDFVKERDNQVVFQAQGNNCSAWVDETLRFVYPKKELPTLFAIHYSEGSGPKPMSYIIDFIKFTARAISATAGNITRVAISVIFGAWRGYTTGVDGEEGQTERLVTNETWRDEKLLLPGTLFRRCQEASKENMKGYLALRVGAA